MYLKHLSVSFNFQVCGSYSQFCSSEKMKCLRDLFVSLCQYLLALCSLFMAMLTKAISWALSLEPAQVGDNKELTLVVDKQSSPSFSDSCSSGSFEVEDYTDKEDCDYYVISKAKKEQVVSDEKQAAGKDGDSPHKNEKTLCVLSCTDIPIRMKNASGIYYKEELHIGGGYVAKSKESSIIHVYNPTFDMWGSLPPSPLKWFSIALLDGKLVLVGGKEVGSSTLAYTNKLAVWNEQDKAWSFSLPPMKVPRSSPVVISHDGYLLVAGGKKGALDYNMEVYDSTNRLWFNAPPLPLPCSMITSAVVGDVWYLMSQSDGGILQASIPLLIKQVVKKEGSLLIEPEAEQEIEASNKEAKGLWKKLTVRPPVLPFRIISFGEYLVTLSHKNGNLELHALSTHSACDESSWIHLGKLPGICANASTLSTSQQLFLFGGDAANKQYSPKLFKVSILTKEEAMQQKKERCPHVTIGATTTVSS